MILAWWLADVGLQDIAQAILDKYPEPYKFDYMGYTYWIGTP